MSPCSGDVIGAAKENSRSKLNPTSIDLFLGY